MHKRHDLREINLGPVIIWRCSYMRKVSRPPSRVLDRVGTAKIAFSVVPPVAKASSRSVAYLTQRLSGSVINIGIYLPGKPSQRSLCTMSEPKVLIVGAGAVGAFYGSRLAQGAQVSCICRSNYPAVSKNGFKMKTRSFGDFDFKPAHVFSSPAECQKSSIRWDYAVVTTKALPDVNDDTKLIQGLLTEGHTAIVLIQNGVGVEEPYRRAFPSNPILSAVTIVSAVQSEPGIIVQNRWTRISIGPYSGDGDQSSPIPTEAAAKRNDRATRMNTEFVELLKTGGIKDAEDYDEAGLQLVRWHKIAINAAMNPSAVLSNGAGNAEMSLDPELRIHLKGVMQEVLETAPKVLRRPFPDKLATADQILKSTERNTGGKPSMLIDWQKGQKMELEVILGNPVRIARKKGFEMPRLQSLYALLKMAQTRRDSDKSKL